ncbi:uncharacterized protein [Nicotiana sylvestris]|uniref:uncharacterized protein n=1 Tax=Nicotiana sylvestris TaxID=4096 RepID=UPI00388C55E5
MNFKLVLEHCESTHLDLNYQKCHFMMKERIFLGRKVTALGIEVDRSKVNVIARLPSPTSIKSIRSFLGHVGFYRMFIKNLSSITKSLTALLAKEVKFVFNVECLRALKLIKEKLVSAPIMVTLDWSQPFRIMCDASDVAVGAVLGQRKDKMFRPIYDASRTLNNAQVNYATIEKEFFIVVLTLYKFRQYLVGSKVIVHTDHSTLKYLLSKNESKYGAIRRCVPEGEMASVLSHCHDGVVGGHYGGNRTATKVREVGFFWPTLYKDARAYVAACDNVSEGSTSRKDWSVKLDEALSAYRTVFKTTIGTSSFKLVYGKLCHLPVEIEHKAYWAIKMLNLDISLAGEQRLAQMNELEEFRLDAYENSWIFKEKYKRWHDRLIKLMEFHEGDRVLLYNSRLGLFPEKFKSRWTGSYVVKHLSPYREIEIHNQDGIESFKVNGHRLKPYLAGVFSQ